MKHPLVSIAIAFITGITTARALWEHTAPRTWLAITILMLLTALAIGSKPHITAHSHQQPFTLCKAYIQSILIMFCCFALGAYLATTEMRQQQQPATIMSSQELNPLTRTILKAQHLQKDIAAKYKQLGFNGQEYAIITAMTLGDKSSIDKNTAETYTQSGVNHILAISGMHMAILFQAVILLLGGSRRSKIIMPLSLIAIWSYAFLTGLPISVVRASIMITLYVLVTMLHRNALTLNTLALAAIIILSIHPMSLFSISFQMSFLAVLSITLFLPIINIHKPHICDKNPIAQWIWQTAALSLCAQICIVPIIAYYFNQFSLYALISNFIAIPFATILICGCLLLFILSPMPFLQDYCAQILNAITQAVNHSFTYIAHLPNAYMDDIHINILQLCLIYCAIGAIYLLATKYEHPNQQPSSYKVKK